MDAGHRVPFLPGPELCEMPLAMESRLALAETDGDGERGAEYGNRRAYILHPESD